MLYPISNPFLLKNPVSVCHQCKLRLNTFRMQWLDSSKSACPGAAIVTAPLALDTDISAAVPRCLPPP